MQIALSEVLRPKRHAHAHCDLPCGVYDPAQARIEAESIKAIQERYGDAAAGGVIAGIGLVVTLLGI